MELAEPAQSLAVVACPTPAHLAGMARILTPEALGDLGGLRFVVHLAPAAVLADARYASWAAAVSGPQTQHIFANRVMSPERCVFRASAKIQARLAQRVPGGLFRPDATAIAERNADGATPLQAVAPELAALLGERAIVADMCMQLVLHPQSRRGLHPAEPDDNADLSGCDTVNLAGQSDCPAPSDGAGKSSKGFSISFLGTGAAIPSKYRNVTSMLCRLPAGEDGRAPSAILMDAGEGTTIQIGRLLGTAAAEKLLREELALVWVSHMHADHHLGLLRILHERGPQSAPLHIMGPDILGDFLACCMRGDPSITGKFHFSPIVRSNTGLAEIVAAAETSRQADALAAELVRCGVARLVSVPVIHCFNSFGLVLDLASGERIVYSGDTRPCDELVDAGKGADLLIHEATFEEEKKDEAVGKKHSTTAEAISIGSRMGAKFTALTHFSQRYPKVSPKSGAGEETRVIVASDLMTIFSSDLDAASAATPEIAAVLAEFEADK